MGAKRPKSQVFYISYSLSNISYFQLYILYFLFFIFSIQYLLFSTLYPIFPILYILYPISPIFNSISYISYSLSYISCTLFPILYSLYFLIKFKRRGFYFIILQRKEISVLFMNIKNMKWKFSRENCFIFCSYIKSSKHHFHKKLVLKRVSNHT